MMMVKTTPGDYLGVRKWAVEQAIILMQTCDAHRGVELKTVVAEVVAEVEGTKP